MKYTSFKEELTDSGHQICRQASLGRTGIQTKTPPVLLLTSCSHWHCTASPPSPSSWYYNHARSAFPQHQAASLTSFYACFRALWSSSILCVNVTASREWNPCFLQLIFSRSQQQYAQLTTHPSGTTAVGNLCSTAQQKIKLKVILT